MLYQRTLTRRQLLAGASGAAAACLLAGCHNVANVAPTTQPGAGAGHPTTRPNDPDAIIDIHQHTTYRGRSNEALFHHQYKMGVTQTILLPGGSPVDTPATLKGKANGLYAGAGTVDTCIPIARQYPHVFYFAANEVPDIPEARQRIESALRQGGVCIGEQKFNLPVDSPQMEMIYSIAQEYRVPVLMHFQYEMFNTGYERFGDVLKKWHRVTFIGHANTFWTNIDAKADQKVGYPKGKVTPGGLTDRYLSDHANFYADMSAYSGLNALIRDEDHARGFIARHYRRMMFGSDCPDPAGEGPTCSGANMIAAIRRLSSGKSVERKILHDNAKTVFKLD